MLRENYKKVAVGKIDVNSQMGNGEVKTIKTNASFPINRAILLVQCGESQTPKLGTLAVVDSANPDFKSTLWADTHPSKGIEGYFLKFNSISGDSVSFVGRGYNQTSEYIKWIEYIVIS